jgi:heme exporter protein D
VQLPIEIVFGTGGALALALLWIHDLRQERNLLKERLYKLLDKIDVAARPDPK